MPTPSLVVFGGSGFLGSQVSKAALRKGWGVTCISRSGKPPTSQDWHDGVSWTKGDAFDPSTYASTVSAATHVVSCIGILDYRGVRTSRRASKALDSLGSTLYDAIATRLDGTYQTTELLRYERLNYVANSTVAKEVVRHKGVKSFIYVSAADGFPGVPRQYIETKRKTEGVLEHLSRDSAAARMVWIRPGFMYAPTGPTNVLAHVLGLSYALNSSLDGRLSLPLGAAGVKPLAVERVGSAIVEACDDERIAGAVEVHQIEALADVRWRAEMIV